MCTSTKPIFSHATSDNLQQSTELRKHRTDALNGRAVHAYFYEEDEFTTLVDEVHFIIFRRDTSFD